MKRQQHEPNASDSSLLLSLVPADCLLLILSASGFDVFTWNCCSTALRGFVREHRVFERVAELRGYYHACFQSGMPTACDTPLGLLGQRLVTLAPRFLSVNCYWSPVSPDVLAQLSGSLVSLSIDDLSVAQRRGKKAEPGLEERYIASGVLGTLTGLRCLDLNDFPRKHAPAKALWSQLARLTNLRALTAFCEFRVRSFDFLRKLTQLRHLDFFCSCDHAMQVEDVAHLPLLSSLVLEADAVSDDVNKLTSLSRLYLRPSCDSAGDTDDEASDRGLALVTETRISAQVDTWLDRSIQFDVLGEDRQAVEAQYYWLHTPYCGRLLASGVESDSDSV